jgi:hypothetical protein
MVLPRLSPRRRRFSEDPFGPTLERLMGGAAGVCLGPLVDRHGTRLLFTAHDRWCAARNRAAAGAPESSPESARSPHGPQRQAAPTPERTGARGAPASPSAPGTSSPAAPGPQWRESPNDERWKRAEQLRSPAAGGVTTSGLPRRVPRANLVAGTAQEQESAAPVGPQVSRSPDDVRGRLTNLRRGIQQGRQAGSMAGGKNRTGQGFGSPYPQER